MRTARSSSSMLLRLWRSRFFTIGAVILLIVFSLSLGKEISRRVKVNQEVESLQQDVSSLATRNTELQKLIAYLNTDVVLEKEARARLGLQKSGESVLIIPEVGALSSEAVLSAQAEQEIASAVSNPQQWWNYFFK